VFSNIDIMLGDETGRLKCSATGDPAPTLFWIEPNGRTTKYPQSTTTSVHVPTSASGGTAGAAVDDPARRTDAVLMLTDRPSTALAAAAAMSASPVTGLYICVANNEAGNVTLAVNISWPSLAAAASAPSQLSPPTVYSSPSHNNNDDGNGHAVAVNTTTLTEDDPLSPNVSRSARLFSVTELVCAVVITHAATLLAVVIVVAIFIHHRAAHRRLQQQLLPQPALVQPTSMATALPSSDLASESHILRRATDAAMHAAAVDSTYRHNGFQLPGMTGRSTPYANDCLYECGTVRSGFSYTASNRR